MEEHGKSEKQNRFLALPSSVALAALDRTLTSAAQLVGKVVLAAPFPCFDASAHLRVDESPGGQTRSAPRKGETVDDPLLFCCPSNKS